MLEGQPRLCVVGFADIVMLLLFQKTLAKGLQRRCLAWYDDGMIRCDFVRCCARTEIHYSYSGLGYLELSRLAASANIRKYNRL